MEMRKLCTVHCALQDGLSIVSDIHLLTELLSYSHPTLHPQRWPLQVVIMTLKLNERSCNLIVCPQVRPITFLATIP